MQAAGSAQAAEGKEGSSAEVDVSGGAHPVKRLTEQKRDYGCDCQNTTLQHGTILALISSRSPQ